PAPTVRAEAVFGFGCLASPDAAAAARRAAQDDDYRVRWSAVRALGRHEAVDDLIERLEDAHPLVARTAATWLGEIGGAMAVQALRTSLRSKRWSVRYEIARSLSRVGDAEALDDLRLLYARLTKRSRKEA